MDYVAVEPKSQKNRGRRSIEDLVEAIFDGVPTNTLISITSLAEEVNCTWRTTEKWLTLIWRIQRGPSLSALKPKGGKRLLWQRERGSFPSKPSGVE